MEPLKPKPPTPLPVNKPQVPTEMEQPTKPAIQSKEIWGAVVKIIGIILLAFGIVYEPEFLLDGWQSEDITALLGAIVTILGQAWEKYGARAATTLIKGFLFQK